MNVVLQSLSLRPGSGTSRIGLATRIIFWMTGVNALSAAPDFRKNCDVRIKNE